MSEEIENYYGIPTEAQKPFKFANKIPTKEDLNKIVCKQVVEIVSLQQKVEQQENEINRLNNIINELEKWCNECIDNLIIAREHGYTTISDTFFEIFLDKLKALKENK